MPIEAKDEGRIAADESYTPPPSMARSASDWATSFIRGLAKGGIGLAGLPGDVSEMVGKGVKAVGGAIGLPEPPREADQPRLTSPKTSEQLTGAVESVAGKFGEPKTEVGKYAQSVGEFIPGMLPGGGAMLPKLGRAVAGGLGSEKAGQLAESYFGERAGPLGRLLGGALGAGSSLPRIGKEAIPTAEALKAASDKAYKEAAALPLELDRSGMDKLHKSIVTDLHAMPTREILAPQTFKLTEELLNPAGKNVTVSDIDAVRKMLGEVTGSKADMKAARLVRERIDDYLANIPLGHVVSGDPTPVSRIFQEARGNYAPLMRSKMITEALTKAERQAASTGSGANIDNAIRQKIRSILDNDKKRRGFSKDEIEQMERIVRGGPIRDIARKVGKLAPTGVVSLAPTLMAKIAGGDLPAAALAGTGYAAKNLSEHLTKKGVRDLDRMIRSRAAMYAGGPVGLGATPEATTLESIIRSALAANANRGDWIVEPGEGIEGSTRIRPNR